MGILVIADRVVATGIQRVFERIFESELTSSNYGFRRGRSQHQAIVFLGFRIVGLRIRISEEALDRFKQKVRVLTRRNNRLSMRQVITAHSESAESSANARGGGSSKTVRVLRSEDNAAPKQIVVDLLR